MIKKYFTPALRHLWRQPLFTTLNIFGLAIGISACWVIYRIASYEFSFEKNIPDAAHIYSLVTGYGQGDHAGAMNAVPKPLYQSIEKEATGITRAVPVFRKNVFDVKVNTVEGNPIVFSERKAVVSTSPNYFSMLPYRWLAGNPTKALTAPDQVVLTQSCAQLYFPGKSPAEILNRTITYNGGDTVTRTVVGVVADLKGNTEFNNQEFCSLPEKEYTQNDWNNTNGGDKVYVQLMPQADPSRVESTINTIHDRKTLEIHKLEDLTYDWKSHYKLLPLLESHFAMNVYDSDVHKANKKVIFSLIGVALFLLILACINYINMGIASIPQRAKEIGVRKTLGSSRSILIIQFLCETLISTLVASMLAYGLGLAEFAFLKDIVPEGIRPTEGIWSLGLFILIISLTVTLLSGLYPGWLITKVKTVNVFRHAFILKNRGGRVTLQRSLIVLQFVIAIVFITGAVIVGQQLRYMLYSDMGFTGDAVMVTDIPLYLDNRAPASSRFSLLDELKTIPGVQQACFGEQPLGEGCSSWGGITYNLAAKNPQKGTVYHKTIDTSYLSLYGIHLLAGRNLSASDTSREWLINLSAAKKMGFTSPQEAIGKMFGQDESRLMPIVGVVNDFHFLKFYDNIDPIALTMDKSDFYCINIKLSGNPQDWPNTLKAIEQKWNTFYPQGSFSYHFYDEAIANLYKDERHLDTLINLTMIISIVISCMGLFGLAVLTAFQRTKEIGIRKVMGASVPSIMGLLSKEYLRLVFLAFILATPITWLAMNKWLQHFAYRLPLHWWLFAVSGIIALCAALLTVGYQAWKAAKTNPVISLRTE